ncbi:helix-turn-helix domain-containing protein [Streptomyces sp. MB09-01]|uniref:helix-turn-helix domain-containing protein n=1 Tax=Streptomyces sp. MB09-01 TaxID=3028666 RepID=UPI0029B6D5C8|nr:helix-turn-helix domain-containing protein [Streptomyces sp. MB09-01]MDX3540653.1 helix-turn-helix domain-containing protein [Streptomyces sp. MB09-01]
MGNHLLQHPELSATAIGVAAYIQSLPDGAPVGIKALTDRFREGEVRIASALRELERHGYLERRRERLATGQVVTRTFSYNRPGVVADPAVPRPSDVPPPPDDPPPPPVREPLPGPGRGRAFDALPVPQAVHRGAADLLAGLRRYDSRLLLAERDLRRLVPGVSAWLERGADPEAVARALSGGLPERMRDPASVLAYRLTALVPPHLPPDPVVRRPGRPDPFQTCDGCERAFRAPVPGRCGDCPPVAA